MAEKVEKTVAFRTLIFFENEKRIIYVVQKNISAERNCLNPVCGRNVFLGKFMLFLCLLGVPPLRSVAKKLEKTIAFRNLFFLEIRNGSNLLFKKI